MKRILALCAVLALVVCMTGCGTAGSGDTQDGAAADQNAAAADAADDAAASEDADRDGQSTTVAASDKEDKYASGTHKVRMKLEGYGKVEFTIYSDYAPATASAFCHLVDDGYFTDKTLYTLMDGLYLRIGDADLAGSDDYLIDGEYEKAGYYTNSLSLTRGMLAMPCTDDETQSDSSSFMIMLSDVSYLDSNYAAFGKVSSGMKVLEKIVNELSHETDNNGHITKASKQPKIKSMKNIKQKTTAQRISDAVDTAVNPPVEFDKPTQIVLHEGKKKATKLTADDEGYAAVYDIMDASYDLTLQDTDVEEVKNLQQIKSVEYIYDEEQTATVRDDEGRSKITYTRVMFCLSGKLAGQIAFYQDGAYTGQTLLNEKYEKQIEQLAEL